MNKMISVKEIIVETTCNVLDENGEFSRAIPVFKRNFSKRTKEMWNMFESPDKFTNFELSEKANEMIKLLSALKHDISEYSKNTGEIEDWVE
jgi:hypothetical protein